MVKLLATKSIYLHFTRTVNKTDIYEVYYKSFLLGLKINVSHKPLTHFFQRFPYGFLMFSGGKERVHWKQMSSKWQLQKTVLSCTCVIDTNYFAECFLLHAITGTFVLNVITGNKCCWKARKVLENTCEGVHFHRRVIFNDFAKHFNYLSPFWESLGISIS